MSDILSNNTNEHQFTFFVFITIRAEHNNIHFAYVGMKFGCKVNEFSAIILMYFVTIITMDYSDYLLTLLFKLYICISPNNNNTLFAILLW